MTTYNTGNPLGSSAAKDLYDNAQNLDVALNSITQAIWSDRLGRTRRSYWGMEQAFSAQLLSQEQRFNIFIQNSGYEVIGDYEDGPLTIAEYNQLIRYDNELWKITAATGIPYTTTGNDAASWVTDSAHLVSVGDGALRQNLLSPADGLGDELLTVNQPFPGAIARSQHNKNADFISIKDFGAECDCDSDTGLGTDDSDAVQAAILACGESGKDLYVPGACLITKELYIRKPVKIFGCGAGQGYGRTGLLKYKVRSGFVFKGAGIRSVRTRRVYRASAADPQDNPLSVGLNVQSEFVTLENFCVYLWFDKTDNSPSNKGSEWDVGIFNGCRVHFKTHGVHIQGYWRVAAEYNDVTRGIGYPQFNDPAGVPYDAGSVDYGADGRSMFDCYYRGGRWGLKVFGAQPKTGAADYGDPYYDELSGTTLPDTRGAFGFSDFSPVNCSIYGPEHHSNRRWVDSTGDYLSEGESAGCMWIDGLGGASSSTLQGMRFISCRFTSGEAFRVRLDGVNRPVFISCHIEVNSQMTKTDGSPLVSTDYYGPCTATLRSTRVYFQNIGGYSINYAYFPDLTQLNNLAPGATDVTSYIAGFVSTNRGISAITGNDLLLDATTGQVVRARINGVTVLRATATDLIMDSTGNFRPVSNALNDIGRINNI